ncbi:3-phosphoshikimate 1-carboxyvinyltransferase [Rossellomorea vietnamensis]|uniref:3-phosphoshikimate 1-carboxyvinyltransferase n=1 Tax=Rossellomorea vietnamensis TaxID=218284 RepID=UPI003D2CB98E
MAHLDLKARSPWSELKNIKSLEIKPLGSKTLRKDITIPGSKSFTNRALILGAVANGTTQLSGILKSDDSYWCIKTLNELGVKTDIVDESIAIEGCGGKWVDHLSLYIGAAGTIGRFLPGVLAADPSSESSWNLEASERMSQRPIMPLIEAINTLGGRIEYKEKEGYFPLEIRGGGLSGGEVSISGKTSSQFISGLLLASPLTKQDVKITVIDELVQQEYVKITIDLMEKFGVKISHSKDFKVFEIPRGSYKGRNLQLEADVSTACYFFALAAITKGSIKITNVNPKTNQPDIMMLEVFERLGCEITTGKDWIEVKGPEVLTGGFQISMKEMSDQALTLATIAPFANEPITIREVEHIRTHESDRISAICTELKKMGIKVDEYKDGLTVYPGEPKSAIVETYDDHRVAMSLSLIGTRVPGIKVNNPGTVSKTCPTYFSLLENMGIGITYHRE